MNKHKHDMQKGQFTSRDQLSLALVSPLGTVLDAPTWLTGITCTQSIWSIRHPQQAHIISFTAYQEVHQQSTLYAFWQFAFSFFSWSSLTLPMLPSPILNARIRREIKSINPLLGLLNLSHCSPFPMALQLQLLAHYMQCSFQISIQMAMGRSPPQFAQPLVSFCSP